MTNYYVEKDNKILLYDTDRETLEDTLLFMPGYSDLEIQETERPIENFEFADTDEYKAKVSAAERKRLDKLSLTKREVFLALYKDKGLTPEQIRASITDAEALIEFDYANDYYRGNPLINAIGEQLGYTSDELDYLFENGGFREVEQ